MIGFAPLFAKKDWTDLIPIVVVIIFFVISALGQWIAKAARQQKLAGRAQRPVAGPRPAPGGNVDDEIADFLRRATQRRGGEAAAPPQPAGPPAMAEIVEPEVIGQQPVGGRVGRHVGQYLDAGEFERRAGRLGDEVAHADDQIEQRLHQVFDHEVSRLAGVPGESAEAPLVAEALHPEDRVGQFPSTAAAGLPVLLSNAQNIRQAIIVNEILQRPEHRWT